MPPMLDAKTDDRRAVAVADVFCLHVLLCTTISQLWASFLSAVSASCVRAAGAGGVQC